MLEDKWIRNGYLTTNLFIHGSNEGLVNCIAQSAESAHRAQDNCTYLPYTSEPMMKHSRWGHHATQGEMTNTHLKYTILALPIRHQDSTH